MTKTVRNWVVSAFVILFAVIGVYYSFQGEEGADHSSPHSDHSSHDEHSHDANENSVKQTIDIEVIYTDTALTISLADEDGNIPELMLTHEKWMHLIVINEHLDTFIHLHPEQLDDGTFYVEYALEPDHYQLFVDIKPVNSPYKPEPIELDLNAEAAHQHAHLTNEGTNVKEVDGIIVELNHDDIKAGETVPLKFDLTNATPEPYLGALGHVVIVDEQLTNFIHVHPQTTDQTVFHAFFENAGMYKVWSEFKVDGVVHTFSYIIEVEE